MPLFKRNPNETAYAGGKKHITDVLKNSGPEGALLYRIPEGADAEEQARGLLETVKRIEREMGRTDPPEYDGAGNRIYHSRIIDIDILFVGSLRMDTPELTIPHKGIKERAFVMIPLLEIAKPTLKAAFPEIFD